MVQHHDWRPIRHGGRRAMAAVAVAGILYCAAGCHRPDVKFIQQVHEGQYGQARADLLPRLNVDKGDRAYTITRMKLGLMELADGLPEAAEATLSETYDILRTQGLNEDKTVEAVVVNERVKRWKGEPFEQAIMYCFIGMQNATRGDWGNARAAVNNALFMLKDFSNQSHADGKSRMLSVSRFHARTLQAGPQHMPLTKTVWIANREGTWHEQTSERTVTPRTKAEMRRQMLEGGSGHDPRRVTEHSSTLWPRSEKVAWLAHKRFFETLHQGYDVDLIGEDVVEDHDVWVIQAKTKKQPPGAGHRDDGRPLVLHITYAFDKNTGVLVRKTISDEQGHMLQSVTLVTTDMNAEVPAAAMDPGPLPPEQDMRDMDGIQQWLDAVVP